MQDPSIANDVDSIFHQARQMGAVEGPIDNLLPSSSSRSFTGTGRTTFRRNSAVSPQQPETVIHNIVFWSNGFTCE